MLSRRFFLSLVAGLSLSTLASANSINVNVTSLHAAGDGRANSYAGQWAIVKFTPAMSIAYATRTSAGADRQQASSHRHSEM